MLLVNRQQLLTKTLDFENSVRGSLKVFRLRIGTVTRRTFEARVLELVASKLRHQFWVPYFDGPLFDVLGNLAIVPRYIPERLVACPRSGHRLADWHVKPGRDSSSRPSLLPSAC